MARRLWDLALVLGFACGVYLAVVNRHAGDLRAGARAAQQWRTGNVGERKEPSSVELAALAFRPRELIDGQCNKEGGNPFDQRNCYAEAASLMVQEAREQEATRDAAYLVLATAVLLTTMTFVLRRRQRTRHDDLEALARSG